jgi:hypothetical protein
LANLVAAGPDTGFTHELGAADFLRAALRHPNLLAASARRGLAAERLARTWAIHATATARIPCEAAGLANGLGVGLARNLIGLSFPMTTADGNRFGIGNGFADVIGFLTFTRFPHRLADCVIALTGFPHSLEGCVRHFTSASFPDRLADGVAAGLGFPDRLAHGIAASFGFPHGMVRRVADIAGLGFPDRLAHGIAASFGFPHRVIRGVADVARLGFPNRLADGVAAGLGFPDRAANGVADLFLSLFAYVAGAVNHPIFAHTVVNCFAALNLFFVPFNTPHRLHDGMATLLIATRRAAVVTCDPAIPRPCH